jgi:cysteine desulfuration protein SufE
MSENINAIQEQIILNFAQFQTWEQKYKYLIKLGKELTPMEDQDKSEDLKVKGCQSQVWLKASLNADGGVQFQADSDAIIVRGLVALLIKVYSQQKPQDILTTAPYFIEKIELAQHLSASRTNGLNSMIKQIKYYAQAFSLISRV